LTLIPTEPRKARWRGETFKAVKRLQCAECGRWIEAGEEYAYERLKSGAEVAVCRRCAG